MMLKTRRSKKKEIKLGSIPLNRNHSNEKTTLWVAFSLEQMTGDRVGFDSPQSESFQ